MLEHARGYREDILNGRWVIDRSGITAPEIVTLEEINTVLERVGQPTCPPRSPPSPTPPRTTPTRSTHSSGSRGVPVKDGEWGCRLLVVEDLDGNQLFFNYPNEPE